MELTKRYEPTWVPVSGDEEFKEEFLGHAGAIDVYYQDHRPEGGEQVAYVVGPIDRLIKGGSPHNFDAYTIKDGALIVYDVVGKDVHVEIDEMCLLYQMLEARGLLNEEE
jgi:hypothetical protein